VQQAEAHCQRQEKQRNKTCFDVPLFDVGIPKSLRVLFETIDFRLFLGSGFDGLNPINVFSQAAVERAEGRANFARDWFKDPQEVYDRYKIKNDEHLLTFGENHILIEVSMGMKEALLDAVIFELTTRKYKPILAHVERYVYMFDQGKLDYYQQLKDADVLLQVNIRSFLGQYGEIPKKIARKLAVNNMIDYLGTDLHNEAQLPMIKDALNDAYIQNLLKGNTLKNNLL